MTSSISQLMFKVYFVYTHELYLVLKERLLVTRGWGSAHLGLQLSVDVCEHGSVHRRQRRWGLRGSPLDRLLAAEHDLRSENVTRNETIHGTKRYMKRNVYAKREPEKKKRNKKKKRQNDKTNWTEKQKQDPSDTVVYIVDFSSVDGSCLCSFFYITYEPHRFETKRNEPKRNVKRIETNFKKAWGEPKRKTTTIRNGKQKQRHTSKGHERAGEGWAAGPDTHPS